MDVKAIKNSSLEENISCHSSAILVIEIFISPIIRCSPMPRSGWEWHMSDWNVSAVSKSTWSMNTERTVAHYPTLVFVEAVQSESEKSTTRLTQSDTTVWEYLVTAGDTDTLVQKNWRYYCNTSFSMAQLVRMTASSKMCRFPQHSRSTSTAMMKFHTS